MKGSNSKQNKAINLRLVLSEIVTCAPISRVEISRRTLLTKQTITNLVEELLAVELIEEVGIKKEGSVGKPSKMLSLKADTAFSVAFRVMPNELNAGIYTLTGEQIFSLKKLLGHEDVIGVAKRCLDELLVQASIGHEQILSAALSVSQADAQNLQDHQSAKALQQALSEQLQLPVALETTAAACAAFHMLYGEAKKLHSFIYVHIGDVVESAVVFDRKIMLGQNGLTGAIGDCFVTPETDQATGELGRLNDFASLNSLKQYLAQTDISNWQLRELCQEELPTVERWVERAAEPLRIAIHTLESMLNCQTIILGGDLDDWLLDKLITQLRPYIPSIAQYGQRDVMRLIKTPNVGVVSLKGVATLPIHAALSDENMKTILFNPLQLKSPVQQLLYG